MREWRTVTPRSERFQLLGARYVLADDREIPGLGVLDVETRAGNGRIVGRVRGTARLWGRTFELLGFENHAGRTTLGSAATPLATVPRGHGNDGRDHGEGATQGNVIGTYLHGPVLAINPDLTDALLARALARVTAGPLEPLGDGVESRARQQLIRRMHEDARPARRRKTAAVGLAAALLIGSFGIPEARETHEGHDVGGFLGQGPAIPTGRAPRSF